ncbi:histidine kinase [Massilia sp. G4R7]|uniref:Histidine kinase n=1 Tax=Massilia phyllostachyos TaxID=2898585 RepID=A0ABS8QBC9_9BURK|nr:histidine kinase [Massilia phyllostachyos]MCD2518838.1 histidine kinase [Massilia phyllostachyos]
MDKTAASGGDSPLPSGLATRLAGWSHRAQQYPVFSKTWYVYRMRSYRVPMILLALVLGAVACLIPKPPADADALAFWMTFPAQWLVIAVALALGRGLAVLVRARGWHPRREAAGIVCALLLGVMVAWSLTPLVKTGGQPPKGRASTELEIERAQDNRIINFAVWLPVLVWLGGSFDLVAYFRQRRLLREADLQAQAERYKNQRNEVEMKLAVLASQVEPHFLFNTLSGVRAAMLSDPQRGVVMIDHLIDYLRSTIPQLRADRATTFVTLGSQCDSVRAYLGVIKARMPRLKVEVECEEALRGALMPPLMLISLVENAVKHGIEPKKGPVSIRVQAARRLDALEVSVLDDGVGFSASSGSGIGLTNIRERLKHLYGADAALTLRARDTGGVAASIVLPLRATMEEHD